MFDSFTQRAVNAVMLAQEETQRLGHREVATAQLLLGLIREETGVAALVLRDAGINLENACLEVEKLQGRGAGYYGNLDFNLHTRQVFDLSSAEAEQLKDSEIDTQHLLLGLLRQLEGGAIKVLQNLGVDPSELRNQVLRRLAEQGHPIAPQFLPSPPPVNHNGTNSNKAHLALIQKILQHPQGSEAQIVKNNPGIIEPELIESVASILEERGDTKGAEFLRGLLTPLSEKKPEATDNLPEVKITGSEPIEISSLPEVSLPVSEPVQLPDPPQNIEPIINVTAPTNQEMEKFIFQLVRVTFESQANEQVVSSFLTENLDKLNDRFPEVLQNWWLSRFTSLDQDQKLKLAKRILEISSLIRKFEGGSRAINMEIALTGYKTIVPIFTQTEYPEQWAITQNCLGLTYLERVQGNREENLKQAIGYFMAALRYYNRDTFPQERKIILANFKRATDEINILSIQENIEMIPQNPERIQAYFYLIEQLLRNPQNQHQAILDDSSELLDAGLIEMMKERAVAEKNRGNLPEAELLIKFSSQVNERLSSYSKDPGLEQLIKVENNRDSATIEVVVISEEEEKQEAYRNLIEQLLACPSGQEPAILMANYSLIDAGLVRLMEQTADKMIQEGEENAANFLQNVAAELTTQLNNPKFLQLIEQAKSDFAQLGIQNSASFLNNLYTQIFAAIANLSLTVPPEEYFTFMGTLFSVIGESMGNLQTIYPFLAANVEKLDENFARILQAYISAMLSEVAPESAQGLAGGVGVFSSLMVDFPLGSKAINIEIAITGYEIAGTVFTREAFPQQWAALQNNLGIAYCQRIRGDRADNLEMAIAKHQDALQIRTRETSPSDWAETQMNLGLGYYQRIKGERADNLERAIQVIEAVLTVYTREAFPERWATAQSNLGEVYRDRIRGDRTDNMERAIQNFQAALTVYTFEAFSTQWAMIQNSLGVTYLGRIRGEQAENLEQAIRFLEATLTVYTPEAFPFEWAKTQSNLGITYWKRICGQKAENIERGIRCFEAALTVYNRFDFPEQWATAQSNLSNLYIERIRDEQADNIERAIQLCQAALTVRTREALPTDWATTQLVVGNAFSARIRGEQADNWERAIQAYQSALTVLTYDSFPEQWGMLQHNLSRAYMNRIRGDIADNLERAVQAGEAALTVRTREAFPVDWAMTQDGLARVYSSRIRGEKADNLERAIQACQAALTIYTRESFPEHWAGIQSILGSVYVDRIREEKAKNVEKAIKACEAALTIYTRESFPQKWAMTQGTLTIGYRDRIRGERAENIEQSIQACEAALTVFTRESFPQEWATTQSNLGLSYWQRIRGDRAENLERALAALEAALTICNREASPTDWALTQLNLGVVYLNRVRGEDAENRERAIQSQELALTIYTRTGFPDTWAKLQSNLGSAYRERLKGDRAENLELAIQACEAALTVYTRTAFPEQWASTQLNLGTAYADRFRGDRAENLEKAIAAYEAALTIYTHESFPQQWAMIQTNLGVAYRQRLRGGKAENIERAIASYRNAIQVRTRIAYPLDRAITLSSLGFTYLKDRQFHRAYKVFKYAIKTFEFLRGEIISGDRVKRKLSEQMFGIYQYIIKACLELATTKPHYYTKALEYVERNKARNLVELLASRDLFPKGNVPEAVVKEMQRLRREITAEQRRLDNAKANSAVDSIISSEESQRLNSSPAAIIPDRTRLSQLQQQLDNLIARDIQHIDPNFSSTQKVNPISFSEIQSLLPDEKTVIIEWFLAMPFHRQNNFLQGDQFTERDITGESFFTFITTKQSKHPLVLPSPTNNYEALWEWHIDYWKAYFEQKEQWKNQLESRLERLAEILQIDRIISLIPETYEQLILIPHWLLHLFPLHALPLSKAECLLDRFPGGVRYAPSCQLLQISQNHQRHDFSHLFAIQNPTKDLEYTDIEVEAIRQSFKPYDDVLVKDAAKKELIDNQRIHSAHCAHFSCHGYFNFEDPLQSALILAEAKTFEKSQQADTKRHLSTRSGGIFDLDKCLTLGEIFDLDLSQCRIVTLSACETGITDFSGFTEYINLPSAFLYAGSLSVISSLWTVNDLSTTFLMIKLYENLNQQLKEKNELTVAITLRDAQLWLKQVNKTQLEEWLANIPLTNLNHQAQLEDWLSNLEPNIQPFQSPYHWAGFCAIGQ